MPELTESPGLAQIQEYVRQLRQERGFDKNSPERDCLYLGEEVGELFKAVRKAEGLPLDASSTVGSVPDELADVLIFLCAIANHYGIDLETAFRDKEKVNKKRTWQKAGV